MSEATSLVTLTPKNLPAYLAIFGHANDAGYVSNRRADGRRPSTLAFEFLRIHNPASAEMCDAQCVDISEGGIGFLYDAPLKPEEVIQLYLPGETQEYTVAARVVHCEPSGDEFRLGVQFVWE